MKKKWLFGALSAICGLSFGLAISACGDETPNDAANNGTNDNAKIEAIYDEYVIHAEAEGITPLSYEDWLQSIKGADGKSAYQIWLDNGHTGTETDFLNWLKGDETATEESYTAGVHYQKIKGKDEYRVMGIGLAESTDIVIADTYKGLPVTEIAERAFYKCNSLTSVEIGDSVTSIGNSAFGDCDSLTSVEIGDSVTSIGAGAFASCDSLTSITVDEDNSGYKSIDGNLYSKDGETLIKYAIGKTATAFTVPDGVTSIGSSAFGDCDSLTSVEIGDSVTSIGYSAFAYCYSLTSVEIGDSVTSIGEDAFGDCDSLTSVYYKGTAEEWGDITIDSYSGLENATRYYYSETEPTTTGNYWHYNENGEIAVW